MGDEQLVQVSLSQHYLQLAHSLYITLSFKISYSKILRMEGKMVIIAQIQREIHVSLVRIQMEIVASPGHPHQSMRA